jgi:hypothetical protein
MRTRNKRGGELGVGVRVGEDGQSGVVERNFHVMDLTQLAKRRGAAYLLLRVADAFERIAAEFVEEEKDGGDLDAAADWSRAGEAARKAAMVIRAGWTKTKFGTKGQEEKEEAEEQPGLGELLTLEDMGLEKGGEVHESATYVG